MAANGTITAKGYGEATVTASMQNPEGEEVFTAETIITVRPVIAELELISNGSGDNEILLPGDKRTLTATVLPIEADPDQTVTWQVTNPAVLRIPATATDAPMLTVTAGLPGTASVYATAADGRTKVKHFTVAKPHGSVTFEDGKQALALHEGDEPLDVKIKADACLQLALGGFEDGAALPGNELTFEDDTLSASLASPSPGSEEWTLTLTPRAASAQSIDLIVYCPLNPDISARLRVSVHETPAPDVGYQTPHAETQAITVYTQSEAPARLGLWFTGSGAPIGLRALAGQDELANPDCIGFAAANPKKAADVKAAEELAAKFNVTVLDDNTLGFTAKPGESYAKKYKARLVLTLPGAEPVETAEIITVQVSTKAPTLKAAAIKLNSFYNDNAQPIVISGGAVTSLRVDTAKTPAALLSWLDVSGIDEHGQDGAVCMRSDAPKKNSARKLYLVAKLDGWGAKEFAFTVSVSSTSTPPSVKLKSTTAKLYAGYNNSGEEVYSTGAALVLMPKAKTAALADMHFTKASVVPADTANPKTYKNQALYEVVGNAIDPATGAFTLRLLNEETDAPKAGKVLLAFEVGEQNAQSIQLAVNVQVVKKNTRIGLKASKSTVTLNPSFNGGAGEDYTVAITPSVADFDMSDFELNEPLVYNSKGKTLLAEHDLDLQVDGFKLRIGLKPNAARQKTYKVKLPVPGLNRHLTGNKDAALTLTVKTGKLQNPTVKGAVSGKVDLTRSTPATLNLTFSQYLGGAAQVPEITLLNKNKSAYTDIENVGGAFYLTRKGPSSFAVNVDPDNTWVKPGTYYLKLSVELEPGKVITTAPAKLVVTATKPKVTRSPSAIALYKGNPGDDAEFTVTLPDNCFAVREIRVRGAAADIYEVRRLYGNRFALSIKNSAKAKSTTLTLELYLHGNPAAATTHAMKITVR